MSKTQGFTLIEIIVVTIILSLLASWLVPIARPLWQAKPSHELQQLQQLLLHAQQRATFTGQPLIAEIWQGGVVFCAYQEDSWKALTPERTGRYVFQQESDLKLTIDGIQQNLKDRASCEPMIYFEPDGLMSHFVLSIKNDAGTATLTVNDENQLFIR